MMLVCKNYLRHKFENIIISDFDDKRLLDIPIQLKDFSYVIITLTTVSIVQLFKTVGNSGLTYTNRLFIFDNIIFSGSGSPLAILRSSSVFKC